MNCAKTSFSTESLAGAITSVFQYLAPLQFRTPHKSYSLLQVVSSVRPSINFAAPEDLSRNSVTTNRHMAQYSCDSFSSLCDLSRCLETGTKDKTSDTKFTKVLAGFEWQSVAEQYDHGHQLDST
jgi:hypothetical protein